VPDSVYEFARPSEATTPKRQDEHPVLWMKRCLQSARQIEKLAVQVDQSISNRDEEVAQAQMEYNQRSSNATEHLRQQLTEAESTRSKATERAKAEKKRLEDAANSALTSFKLIMPVDTNSTKHVQENAPNLSAQLQSASDASAAAEKALASYTNIFKPEVSSNPWAWGCGGLIAAGIIFGVLINIAQSGSLGIFAVFLFVFGIPAALIWRLTTLKSAVAQCHSELKNVAQLLEIRAGTDEKQAVASALTEYDQAVSRAEAEYKTEYEITQSHRDKSINNFNSACDSKCEQLNRHIRNDHAAVGQEIKELSIGIVHGSWADQGWNTWEPTQVVPGCLRIGTVIPDMPRFHHHMKGLPPLAIPALVDYEAGKGIVIAAGGGLAEARQMAQSAILRLLATVPPASVRFIMIDPVSLGGNVAGFMGLEKYEASLVGGKAWSDARHIEQALTEITEHMETVIQKYLREDYKSIAEYNARARVKEAYRIPVIFDFPVNFTEGTAKRLISIMRNGPRCGVFPIVVADNTKPLPYGVSWNDLTYFAMVLQPSDSPDLVLPDTQTPQPVQQATHGQQSVEDDDDAYDDEEEGDDE
jgi:hypothetical protein